MKTSILFSFIFFFISFSFLSSAQTCKDSLIQPDPNYLCTELYNPKCGCDGNTYRDECSAHFKYGLTWGNWSDGCCGNFDYSIDPTFVVEDLKLKVYVKNKGNISINIYDVYGHVFYSNQLFFNQGLTTDRSISVNTFEYGIYIIVLNLDGDQQVKKFYKSSNK